jgi:predicted RNase H-like HicB family nuclease
MIISFIESKLKRARYKILGDRKYFGEIPGLRGVWASARTLAECQKQLKEVLEDWIVVKIRSGERIPGVSLSFDRRGQFAHA